jgi:hypothetical protein
MDKAKTKVLVSILKDSSLYHTMPHEEKISLILRLEEEYPSLFNPQEDGNSEWKLNGATHPISSQESP